MAYFDASRVSQPTPNAPEVPRAIGMSVALIQVRPPGHFAHVSITTPVVSAWKNYYIWSFLEVPTDFLKYIWVQVAASLLKPPHGGFRSETAVTKPFWK
jgi:hypothetical protein